MPYLPHLVLGIVALAVGLDRAGCPAGGSAAGTRPGAAGPPHGVGGASRAADPAFWLRVAPAAPFVFGSVSLAIVVLPEEVTSARTLSAAFAGLMTTLAFAAGIGVQPAARILAERSDRLGILAGTGAAAAGAAVSAVAVAGPDQVLAGLGAVLLGLAYGLCLVCGLHQAEQLSDATDRGAVLSCYYVLAYLGFSAPYAMDGLNEVFGKPGTFAVLAVAAAVLTGLLAVGAARGRPAVDRGPQAAHTWDHARS